MKSYKRIMMMLVALIAATTGAWADTPKVYTSAVAIADLKKGDILAAGFSLTGNYNDDINFKAKRHKLDGVLNTMSFCSQLSAVYSIDANCVIKDGYNQTFAPVDENNQDGNAWLVTATETGEGITHIYLSGYTYDPNVVPVDWDATTKQGSFAMPGDDVELEAEYYDDATVTGTATAATGVRAGQDKALVTGLTASGGTLVYAVTANSVTTAPADADFAEGNNTAKGITTAGTYRVWYFAAGDATHSPSEPAYKDVTVVSGDFFGLTIAGMEVTSQNKDNIFKGDAKNDGKVIYNSDTHTLTLNGATITCPTGSNDGAILVNIDYPLYVHLQGTTTIDAGGLFAFCSTVGNRDVYFITDEKSPGQLLMKNARGESFFSYVKAHYGNGLGHSDITTDNKQLIALGPVTSPGEGIYWVGQKITISGLTNIKYWDCMDKAAGINGYSAPFTLTAEPERRHFIACSHEMEVDGTLFTVYSDSVVYIIHNKPTFDPEPGIYYEQLAVQLGNVLYPDQYTTFPQYWYYLDDDKDHPMLYADALQFINIVEPTKVSVYILDEHLGRTVTNKDNPVVAEYTIRHKIKVGANGDVQFAYGQTWASFYNTTTNDLYLPDDLAAYIVTAADDKSATLKPINYVPKNVAVFLEYGQTSTTTNTSADGNLLQGTTAATAVSGISGTVYALHNNKLMKVTSGDIPAGRAYLVVNSNSAAPQLSMLKDGGDETTAIQNSQFIIHNEDDAWYDLQGRKLLQKPAKSGIYIKNGKKIVVVNNK